MIEQLDLINFQGHTDSTLEFAEGVNVIIGESDEGKSSIIRAIEYLALNRPSKNNYKNCKCADKEKMIVAGVFNGDVIQRIKSKTINQYQINEEQPFKAIKTEVPKEVQDIIKIKDVNIQSQSDSYFMLNLTAGQVAKKINKVVNLAIMDKVLADTRLDLTSTKQETLFWTNKKKEYSDQEQELLWVIDARKAFTEIEKTKAQLDNKIIFYDTLNALNENYLNIQAEQKPFVALPKALKNLKQLEKQNTFLDKKIQEYNMLIELLDTHNKTKAALFAYKDIQKAQTKLKKLFSLKETLKQKRITWAAMQTIIHLQNKIKHAHQLYSSAKTDFHKALKDNKICPLCERKI